LEDLGIGALYLCPIFESNSNHRYHTYDYFSIDPVLGTDQDFEELLQKAHARGIRIILDGVFNHCSRGFFQFDSVLELGKESPYINWFHIKNFPLKAYSGEPNYECWWNMPALPKFNTENPEVREFLFSVAEYWLSRGIDGWRLDVPNEINDDSFWQEFRLRVKNINKDAYIVGEIWDNPSRWLQGDQFDGVMNYRLRKLLLETFLSQTNEFQEKFSAFSKELVNVCAGNFGVSLNLLSSHDTRRLMSQPNSSIKKMKMLWTLLFFLPGVPCIYYGEEIAMEGGKDPDNRRCFPWGTFLSEERNEFFRYMKELIAWRKNEKTLQYGRLEVVSEADNLRLRRIYAGKYTEMTIQLSKIGSDFTYSYTKTAKTC
jgi:glycosidase